MRTTSFLFGFLLLPALAGAAQHPAGHLHAKPSEKAKKADMCANCSMCKMMMGHEMGDAGKTSKADSKMGSGMMSGGMMGGMMAGARSEGTAITVAVDGTIYIVRSGTLYKFSADLKLLGSAPVPEAGGDSATPAGHEAHH